MSILDNMYKYENKDWLQNLVAKIIEEANKHSVVIYGVTRCGRHAYDIFKEHNITVSIFCDDNPKLGSSKIDNIDIIPIKMLKNRVRGDSYVIICSPTQSSIDKMILNCKSEGFDNVCYFPEFTIDYTNIKMLTAYKSEIENLFSILEDTRSKETVENVLKIRLSGDYGTENILKETVDANEYFPQNIIKLSDNEVYLDAGAYTGDTIDKFLIEVNNKFDKIYAFEMDDDNYRLLDLKVSNLKTNGVNTNDIVLSKIGVYDKNGTLNFVSGMEQSSFVSDTGNVEIPVTTLDSFLMERIPPTFIKMDIEGSEMNALLGAKDTIVSSKPNLAICIYHEPQHLWEIPLYLKTLVPEYKIYIRNHLINLYDIVCYAII